MSLNLHRIARAAITLNHEDETIYLIRSLGQRNVKGRIVNAYDSPEPIIAQVQSASDESLVRPDKYGQSTYSRRVWMNRLESDESKPAGVDRRLARTGDFILFPADQSYWLVTGVPDDMSNVGWCSVVCTRQTNPPEGLDCECCCK